MELHLDGLELENKREIAFFFKDLCVMTHLPGKGSQLTKSPGIFFLIILVTLMPGWSTVSLPLLSRLARILLLL